MNIQLQNGGKQFGAEQPKNPMLLLIIGLAAGFLTLIGGVFLIGLVLAGLFIAGDAEMSDSDSVPRSKNKTQVTTPENISNSTGDIALTGSWSGTLRCTNGEQIEGVFKISESGYPIYSYETKSGSREVELTSEGQSFKFVPLEGGVMSMVVDSLEVSADSISYSISYSKERSGGGTLTQSSGRLTLEAEPTGAALKVKLRVYSNSTMSQPGIVVPGDDTTDQCNGILKQ